MLSVHAFSTTKNFLEVGLYGGPYRQQHHIRLLHGLRQYKSMTYVILILLSHSYRLEVEMSVFLKSFNSDKLFVVSQQTCLFFFDILTYVLEIIAFQIIFCNPVQR